MLNLNNTQKLILNKCSRACVSLCTTVVHNIALNSSDNFYSYPPDNHQSSNDVYWRGGDKYLHELINVELECGPMPNLMVALPNIGGALCSTPQSLVDAHY